MRPQDPEAPLDPGRLTYLEQVPILGPAATLHVNAGSRAQEYSSLGGLSMSCVLNSQQQ